MSSMLLFTLLCIFMYVSANKLSTAEEYDAFGDVVTEFFPDRSGDFQDYIAQYANKNALVSKDPSCWVGRNYDVVHDYCLHMTDEKRSRLALQLTNCHLQRSNLPSYPCEMNEDFGVCTKRLGVDPIAFQAYTSVFVHVDNICQYFQQEAFETSAKEMILKLYSSVLDGATAMLSFQKHTEEVNDNLIGIYQSTERHFEGLSNKQDAILSTTEQLAATAKNANEMLNKIHETNEQMTEDLHTHSIKQAQTLEDARSDISKLSSSVLEEIQAGASAVQESNKLVHTVLESQKAVSLGQIENMETLHDSNRLLALIRDAHEALVDDQQENMNKFKETQNMLLKGQDDLLEKVSATGDDIHSTLEKQHHTLEKQHVSIDSARISVNELLDTQMRIKKLQEKLMSDVSKAQEMVAKIEGLQHKSIDETSTSLDRILKQSKDAEDRINNVLGKLHDNVYRILQVDLSIFNEMMKINSIFFHVGLFAISLAVTTSARTRDARFMLLMELFAGAFFEQYLSSYVILLASPNHATDDMGEFISYWRTFMVVILSFTCALKAWMYTDYNRENNIVLAQNHAILQALTKSIAELRGMNNVSDNSWMQKLTEAMKLPQQDMEDSLRRKDRRRYNESEPQVTDTTAVEVVLEEEDINDGGAVRTLKRKRAK